LQLYECIIAAATASSSLFFGHVCFRSRKPTTIFEVENRRRLSTPKTDMAEENDHDAVAAAIMHSYSCKS